MLGAYRADAAARDVTLSQQLFEHREGGETRRH